LKNTFNDILGKELIFLLKYLEGKRNHYEKFNELILYANGFEMKLNQFMDIALSIIGSHYVEIIQRNDSFCKLKLTQEGIDILKYVSYEEKIIRRTFFWKILEYLFRTFDWLILKPTPIIFKWIFSNTMAKIILFIASLSAGIVSLIQLYKWYKTGEI
jgi:hypothetical protein